MAVGDVALDRLDEERPAAVRLDDLGVEEPPAPVAVDEVTGLDLARPHARMISLAPDITGGASPHVLVASWITGGTTVIDFSDPAKPREIGYYVAEAEDNVPGSRTFASYWYDGYIYVNNAQNSRGFDVLSMQPALPGLVGQDHMNPQTQEPPD